MSMVPIFFQASIPLKCLIKSRVPYERNMNIIFEYDEVNFFYHCIQRCQRVKNKTTVYVCHTSWNTISHSRFAVTPARKLLTKVEARLILYMKLKKQLRVACLCSTRKYDTTGATQRIPLPPPMTKTKIIFITKRNVD